MTGAEPGATMPGGDAEDRAEILFLRDEPEPADLAIVFSCADPEVCRRRAVRGVELYRQGHVPRLLLSGGGTSWKGPTEATVMREAVRAGGVPDAAVLVEPDASNTAENAVFSRDLLEERGLLSGVETVLLVSSEWHMRRVFLHTRKVFPPSVRLLCCPPREGCTRESWRESERCRSLVLAELDIYELFRAAGLFD